ncbi:MAG: dTDP-4-dehydrorhamnose reductase [Pyrinomonadaceae bacterium]
MKILITGANGMVAQATRKHCLSLGDDVASLTREQLDIADKRSVVNLLENERYDSVINCAAWTDVDGCETNREKNYAANARGVENLAIGCRTVGANLITISTDFVFDGAKSGFYNQRDDPNPASEYGRAKLEGERLAQAALARTIIIRVGWIYGPNGRNFLSKVVEKLLNGEAVKAISDSFGTPTYAPDLAKRLRELALLDLPGIYHVANAGEGTSHAGFARAILPDSGLVEDISSETLNRPAPRPQNSRLGCLLSEAIGLEPLRPWEEALHEFVEMNLAGLKG